MHKGLKHRLPVTEQFIMLSQLIQKHMTHQFLEESLILSQTEAFNKLSRLMDRILTKDQAQQVNKEKPEAIEACIIQLQRVAGILGKAFPKTWKLHLDTLTAAKLPLIPSEPVTSFLGASSGASNTGSGAGAEPPPAP